MTDYNYTVMESNKVLTQTIGYQRLKDKQREVIVNFVKKNYVFAMLLTGYGKKVVTPVCQRCTTVFWEAKARLWL